MPQLLNTFYLLETLSCLAFTDTILSQFSFYPLGHSFVSYLVMSSLFYLFLFLTESWDADLLLAMSLLLPSWLLFPLYNSFKHQVDRMTTPKFISLTLSFFLSFRFVIPSCLLDICLYGTQTPQTQHDPSWAHWISLKLACSHLTPDEMFAPVLSSFLSLTTCTL